MKIDLDQILALAGDLSEEGSRERFRRFLLQTAKDPDALRELLASALKGPQIRSALEDLIVSFGLPLGFDVEFGKAGRWSSPSGVSFILEIVGEGGAVDLTGEIEEVEEEREKKKEKEVEREREDGTSTIVLLVALDSEILRIEDAVALGDEEGRFRAISVSALTALSKMAKEYRLTHGDVLLILLATGPSADPLIALIARIISECEAETPTLEEIAAILGPQRWGGEGASDDALAEIIDQSRYYAFGTRGGGKRPAGL